MPLAQAEPGIELLLHLMRQCQIKVLSTKKQVLANRYSFELDVLPLDVRAYEAEIRCATTDVADKNQIAVSQLRRSCGPIGGNPRIKCCERFLQ